MFFFFFCIVFILIYILAAAHYNYNSFDFFSETVVITRATKKREICSESVLPRAARHHENAFEKTPNGSQTANWYLLQLVKSAGPILKCFSAHNNWFCEQEKKITKQQKTQQNTCRFFLRFVFCHFKFLSRTNAKFVVPNRSDVMDLNVPAALKKRRGKKNEYEIHQNWWPILLKNILKRRCHKPVTKLCLFEEVWSEFVVSKDRAPRIKCEQTIYRHSLTHTHSLVGSVLTFNIIFSFFPATKCELGHFCDLAMQNHYLFYEISIFIIIFARITSQLSSSMRKQISTNRVVIGDISVCCRSLLRQSPIRFRRISPKFVNKSQIDVDFLQYATHMNSVWLAAGVYIGELEMRIAMWQFEW